VRRIRLEPIEAGALAPFGTVLAAPPGVARTDFAAPVENRRGAARANLALVRPPAVALPLRVEVMERHRFSTQAFFPLGALVPLLLVAPGGDEGPDLERARAFMVAPGSGVSYAIGIWHMGMATLGAAGTMGMLVHEDGGTGDTEFRPIVPVEITG
jgi:ureidoglycolate lyase